MLDGLFRPRSVAIIGASSNIYSIGHIVLRNLVAHNFQGPIFPSNKWPAVSTRPWSP